MLKFKNVTKSFGDIIALDDLSFDIDEGEFVFLTGPSGSGKTTALRLILRDLLPDAGDILLDDLDLVNLPNKKIPKLRQHIGVVFQDFKVLPERTLRENVEVALAVRGVRKDKWDGQVDHVLNLVELADRATLFPSQLSGGEVQRASMARALVVNPKMILADEPTGNLDWDTAFELMNLFDKISKEGKTVIMATHHRGIVDKMKKREIKLEKKNIKSIKSKEDEKPASTEKEKHKVKKDGGFLNRVKVKVTRKSEARNSKS